MNESIEQNVAEESVEITENNISTEEAEVVASDIKEVVELSEHDKQKIEEIKANYESLIKQEENTKTLNKPLPDSINKPKEEKKDTTETKTSESKEGGSGGGGILGSIFGFLKLFIMGSTGVAAKAISHVDKKIEHPFEKPKERTK